MSLKSTRFASNQRLQQAALNSPPIRRGAGGHHVAIVQQAFIDLGLGMAISTFGGETESRVWQFQAQTGLTRDGVIGRETLEKLDELLPTNGPPPKPLPGRDTNAGAGRKEGRVMQPVRLKNRGGAGPGARACRRLARNRRGSRAGAHCRASAGRACFCWPSSASAGAAPRPGS